MLNNFPSKIYIFGFLSLFLLIGISIGLLDLTVQPVHGSADEAEIFQTQGDFVRRLPLGTNDIVFNPSDQMIYASRPGSVGNGGNSIARINPLTGELVSSVYVGSEPGKMALSDNGQALYVVLEGAFSVRRFDTVNQTAGLQFSIGSDNGSPYTATDIAVAPGNPDILAVARYKNSTSSAGGVAIHNNGVRLPNVGSATFGANYLAFSNSPSLLYGGGNYGGLRTMTVDGSGITAQQPELTFGGGRIKYDNGKIYTSYGEVIDAQSRTLLGTFASTNSNAFVPDSSVGRAYYAVKDPSGNSVTIKVFDINTFILVGGLTIPNVTGVPATLIRYKSNGLAMRTSDNQLFLIQTSWIPTNEPLPTPSATPTLTPTPTPTVYQSFTRQIPLASKDLIYNSATQKLYVSVPSAGNALGNTITTIDPASGNLENWAFIGSEPNKLALSDNQQTLYVGIDGAFSVRKFDIATQTAGAQFYLGNDAFSGPFFAADIDFMPGSSDTIAVSKADYFGPTIIYDSGVKRPQTASTSGPVELTSNNTLYVGTNPINRYAVSVSGLTAQGTIAADGGGGSFTDMKLENDTLYTANGRVIETATQTVKGTFGGLGFGAPFAIDVPNNRAFFLSDANSSSGYSIRAFDLETFLPVGSIPVENLAGTPTSLTRWGTNGLAFRDDRGKIYLLQSDLVSSNGTVPTPTATPTPTPVPSPANIPTFIRQVNLPANDLVYSSATGSLYASVPSFAGVGRGNTITKINPATGALDESVFIGSEPSKMALSSDSQTLYTKLDGAGNAVRRFDIPTQIPGPQFTPGSDFQNIKDMKVMPGNPQTIALAASSNRIAVYDNGVRRPSTFPVGVYNVNLIDFADASTVYGFENESSRVGLAQFSVSESGVTGFNLGAGIINGYNTQIEYDNGLIYSSLGRVVDPVTKSVVGTFQGNGSAMAVDSASKRVFYILNNVLTAFDTETFRKVGSVTLPNYQGTPTSLVRWGANGLAFRTANSSSSVNDSRVYILQTALVTPNSPVPTGIQFGAANYQNTEYSGVLTATVNRTGDFSSGSTVDYATADGTALAGQDYAAASGTLTFAPGETSKTVSIPIINDSVFEGTENFSLVLSNPTGSNVLLVDPSTTNLAINDDDSQPLLLSNNPSVTEPVVGASSQATFTIRLSNPTTQTVSLGYATLNGTATAGSDYVSTSGSLTFAPLETTKTVSVQILGDGNNEPNEIFFLNLSSPVNVYINNSQIAATIVNYNPQTARHTAFDFDGDGRTDISVFRQADRVWYLNQSQAGNGSLQFGFSDDKLVPADYDGDGKTDVAVYRDGIWHLLKSALGYTSVQFGLAGDVPLPGDYDGDGFADIAVWRPSDRFWYIWNSSTGAVSIVQFGLSTDKPVAADYDGDGKMDIAVYRDGVWYVQGSTVGFTSGQFGIASDTPVQADYDGDRKADLAVYRQGVWYIVLSSTGEVRIRQFGLISDKPTVGDYDGDGKADIAVFREGVWYLFQSTNGVASTQFGLSNDLPIPNTFVP